MGKFLYISKSTANKFFQVRKMKLSFGSAYTLRSWMETLPGGPDWYIDTIQVDGYTTTKPIRLYWRDGLEVAEWIFGNPVFANHMFFDPVRVHTVTGEREYTEYMSGDQAWENQVRFMLRPLLSPN